MKIMSFFSIVVNFIFIKANHPMLMTILTVTQSTIMCSIIFFKMNLSWLSYTLFLIFLGGMMILFVYICSLASNEIMPLNLNNWSLMTITIFSLLGCYLINNSNYLMNMKMTNILEKMFNKMFFIITILMMVYLLMVLVIVVKNMTTIMGPLRTKKNF